MSSHSVNGIVLDAIHKLNKRTINVKQNFKKEDLHGQFLWVDTNIFLCSGGFGAFHIDEKKMGRKIYLTSVDPKEKSFYIDDRSEIQGYASKKQILELYNSL